MARGKPGHKIKSYKSQITHRKRRGKLVEIPEEWRGHTVHDQKIHKRKSKKGQGKKYRRKAMR